MSKRIVSARRDTVRIIKKIGIGFSTAQQDWVLYAATEKVTLYRTIIRGSMIGGSGADARGIMAIHKAMVAFAIPQINALSSGVQNIYASDGDIPQNIWVQGTQTKTDQAGFLFMADIKAMRKLAPGQSVYLSNRGDVVNSGFANLTIVMFFKE